MRTRWLVVAVIVLLVAAGALLWFAPSGSGESRPSPDGRYTAHVFNMSAGTITGDRDRYIELRVVEEATGREVWRIIHHHPAGADVPHYGLRDIRFVTWAADSSSVTVPLDSGREWVLAVP